MTIAPVQWNIFARELEALLQTRGLIVSLLDDRGIVFHREKVRRLQQSLRLPGLLITLNPEEMERLTAVLGLNEQEQHRLHAALFATAVEMVLLHRLPADAALAAAENAFQLLFAAACEQPALFHTPSSDNPRLVAQWNIFARELEALLQKRGLALRHLGTQGIVLYRSKIQRLLRSQQSPVHLATLSREEMERAVAILGLNEQEQHRLHAALLATAVEMFLLDRVPSHTALTCAENTFLVFLNCCQSTRHPQGTAAQPVKGPQTVSRSLWSTPLCLQEASVPPGKEVLPISSSMRLSPLGIWDAQPPGGPERGGLTVVTGLVEAWLAELAPATQGTYRERLSQFRQILYMQRYDLLSEPSAITYLARQWVITPQTLPEGSLQESTLSQRLSTLSSFYRFVVRTQQEPRFLTNPIEGIREQLRALPHPTFVLSPLEATCCLQNLDLANALNCRDYALLWIALVSGCTPQKLLALTLGHLAPPVIPGQNPFQLIWSQARLQFPYAPLVLSQDASYALARYLAECHACKPDPSTLLWLSLSDRNYGQPLQDQSIRDIVYKRLHATSLRAFFHARLTACVQRNASSSA
ncbi:MAG TPA: hypothetical protein VGF67_30190 [Ktedonobacteraceae bacterium]